MDIDRHGRRNEAHPAVGGIRDVSTDDLARPRERLEIRREGIVRGSAEGGKSSIENRWESGDRQPSRSFERLRNRSVGIRTKVGDTRPVSAAARLSEPKGRSASWSRKVRCKERARELRIADSAAKRRRRSISRNAPARRSAIAAGGYIRRRPDPERRGTRRQASETPPSNFANAVFGSRNASQTETSRQLETTREARGFIRSSLFESKKR